MKCMQQWIEKDSSSTASVFCIFLSIWLSTNKAIVDLEVVKDSYCISQASEVPQTGEKLKMVTRGLS